MLGLHWSFAQHTREMIWSPRLAEPLIVLRLLTPAFCPVAVPARRMAVPVLRPIAAPPR
jgi:hypothetical protein